MENKAMGVSIKDGALNFHIDTNKDGQPLLVGKLNLSEGLEEIIKRGEAIENAKLVEFKVDLTKLVIKLDTDRDGEELLTLELDLTEGFDEASGFFKKD